MEVLTKLLHIFLFIIMGSCMVIREECIVTNDLQYSIDLGNTFEYQVFFTRETEMYFSVAFKEMYEGKDNDVITILSDKIYRKKKRKYESLGREDMNKSINFPLGWSYVSGVINGTNMRLDVNSQTIQIDFEYQIEYISIISENLSACPKGKPAWKISESRDSSIPLIGLDYISFSLSSDKEFSPFIYMNAYEFPLYYEYGVILGNGNTTLSSGFYEFIFSNVNHEWILQCKLEAGYKDVIMTTSDYIISITVTSKKGEFLLQLDHLFNPSENIDPPRFPMIDSVSISIILIALSIICILVIKKYGLQQRLLKKA